MKNVFNMLSKLFNLVPPFKIEEFFAPNTAVERKVNFLLQLIQTIKTKNIELGKREYESNSGSSVKKPAGKTKSVTFR